MVNDDLRQKWFFSDLRTKILKVAFELSDDPNYTKLNAIDDLEDIADLLEVSSRPIVVVNSSNAQ